MPILEQPPWQRRLLPFAGIAHLELLDYKNQNNDERQKRSRCEEQHGEFCQGDPSSLPVGLGGHRPLDL